MKKIVFLPIEAEGRELDAKIALASKLINKDVTCVIGQHNILNEVVGYFGNGGAYLGKNIFLNNMKSSNAVYESYKKNNFSILWYHEEGGIYLGDEERWKVMLEELLEPGRLEADDHILCWGNFQKEFYDSFKSKASSSVVGGYRFDLRKGSTLRKLLDKTTRVKEKDYILVNTAFSNGNHHRPGQVEYKEMQELSRGDLDYKLKLLDEYSDDVKKMGYFCEMLSFLIKENPDKKFVLRPHPTESLEFYKNAFHEFRNIEITNQYSAVEWISNCSLLIQNGCTTGVEAYFLEKPVISYYPFISSLTHVTTGIGSFSSTLEETNSLLRKISFEPQISSKEKELISVVSNFGTKRSSMDLIAEIVLKSLSTKKGNHIPLLMIKFTLLKRFIINLLKFYPRYLFKEKLRSYEMAISDFPGFKKKFISSKVEAINRINNKKVEFNFISKDLFILSTED